MTTLGLKIGKEIRRNGLSYYLSDAMQLKYIDADYTTYYCIFAPTQEATELYEYKKFMAEMEK